MKAQQMGMAVLGVIVGITGCARITTQVVDKPRVDQELRGNRGYLTGSAPPAAERRSTRQIIKTDIELPTSNELTPWKVRMGTQESAAPAVQAPVARAQTPSHWGQEERAGILNEPEEPEVTRPVASAPVVHHEEAPALSTVYTVRQGDTLEKISAKVYGDGTQWRRIYKANKDKLKSPNRIYAGQRLIIPTSEKTHRKVQEASSSDLK